MKLLIFLGLLSTDLSWGLVTCAPSSCSPPCDGSCTYYVCDETRVNSFELKRLPITTEEIEPVDACEYVKVTATKLPFTVQSTTYQKLPSTVNNSYKVCRGVTLYGSACPPPAPPPVESPTPSPTPVP